MGGQSNWPQTWFISYLEYRIMRKSTYLCNKNISTRANGELITLSIDQSLEEEHAQGEEDFDLRSHFVVFVLKINKFGKVYLGLKVC